MIQVKYKMLFYPEIKILMILTVAQSDLIPTPYSYQYQTVVLSCVHQHWVYFYLYGNLNPMSKNVPLNCISVYHSCWLKVLKTFFFKGVLTEEKLLCPLLLWFQLPALTAYSPTNYHWCLFFLNAFIILMPSPCPLFTLWLRSGWDTCLVNPIPRPAAGS